MNVLDFFISPAFADAASAPAQGGGLQMFLLPVILIVVMYIFMIRPQLKRQKEHQAMLSKLANGDEVITSAGMAGTIDSIGDNFVIVQFADNVCIRVKKSAIGQILPKGTLKSAN